MNEAELIKLWETEENHAFQRLGFFAHKNAVGNPAATMGL